VEPQVVSPPPPKLHTSVPAPEEDDMAPQDISFIESEEETADKGESDESPKEEESTVKSPTPSEALKRLPERLSQLNISSGSKTYRVHHGSSPEKELSPSPTRSARPSISSTFKQARRSSGEGSGPPSLRSPAATTRTEEEEETLAAMRTERLKDDKDAAAGFVISFDDDAPKRTKPALPPRRPSNARRSSSSAGIARKENLPPEVMICIVSSLTLGGSIVICNVARRSIISNYTSVRTYMYSTSLSALNQLSHYI